jgi:DNA (cytosine-5)-methyltransferase 1
MWSPGVPADLCWREAAGEAPFCTFDRALGCSAIIRAHAITLSQGLERMADQLIRGVPEDLHTWIEQERRDQRKSQREFVLNMLERARDAEMATRMPLFAALPKTEAQPPESIPFKFVDLFAGIGGFRMALQRVGGTCRFSCEWDKYSQKTYREWFGDTPYGDIRTLKASDIPDHDILAAGFPCQPFSLAGVSKKKSLGRAHGFECSSQGNLFFTLATLIGEKKPPIVFLENVKNLRSHNGGRTWQVIRESLEDLGYKVFAQIIDAAGWVPQHRERIYIVGFDRKVFGEDIPFSFPEAPEQKPKLADILDPAPDTRYTLTDHLWTYLQDYAKRHQEKGNGFGFGLADLQGVSRTLSARYFKDGSEILIPQKGKNPRRLTPVECQRLMGFDDKLKIVVSDTQAYRQFGNAVVPKVVEAVARRILRVVSWQLTRTKNECLLKRGENGVAAVRKSH